MRAAWYGRQGRARDVLTVGTLPDPEPGPGELRIRIAASGINPGDVKKRQNAYGFGMPYPRVIPHSDGAGVVDLVGPKVAGSWLGRRVWCHGAQSYRPFGTAAELCVVPLDRVVALPDGASFEQGACLGIPGITAHRAVHVAGAVEGRTVLVQGGAGAVGFCAVQLAHRAGARVIATVRHASDQKVARAAGADHVLLAGGDLPAQVRSIAAEGVSHVVEVAFGANLRADLELLAPGGSIATYATDKPEPNVPFWPLVFGNVRLFFLGSDDFPATAKEAAAAELTRALEESWAGIPIARRFPLDEIAGAHEAVEQPAATGRVLVTL